MIRPPKPKHYVTGIDFSDGLLACNCGWHYTNHRATPQDLKDTFDFHRKESGAKLANLSDGIRDDGAGHSFNGEER